MAQTTTQSTPDNELLCFTNCLLPLEDGQLHKKDLWIDTGRGIIVDAQSTFFTHRQRPTQTIDLGGNILSAGLIDIQINGAYGVDFSIYSGDDEAYEAGLRKVAERIVETGVTSLVPTVITQEHALYPKLLHLLRPHAFPRSANLLGWHAEGPFLQPAKKGAHDSSFLVTSAPNGIHSLEEIYGAENLASRPQSVEPTTPTPPFVRMITVAPELPGILQAIPHLVHERGITFSIGHSIASSKIAVGAVLGGANMITHLFNAMPQLHHRDPAIIGLLGAGGPYSSAVVGASAGTSTPASSGKAGGNPLLARIQTTRAFGGGASTPSTSTSPSGPRLLAVASEALGELPTPPGTPSFNVSGSQTFNPAQITAQIKDGATTPGSVSSMSEGDAFQRPYYGMIVDGIHSHPNSVRLAYNTHPEGCILVTDAMSMLDPHLPDGGHEWRDGKRLLKEGDRLSIEGTDTLAGSVVTLDKCVRNFSLFTSTSFAKSILCATLHPAACLGIQDRKGTLRAGADADLTVFDQVDGKVLATWVAGKLVWKRD